MNAAPSRRGMTFSETDLLLRAAIDGLGVALSRRILAQPELDAGRLVRPVRHSVRADRSYFIVHPDAVEPSPRLLIFRDWLLEQARTTTEGTQPCLAQDCVTSASSPARCRPGHGTRSPMCPACASATRR